MEMELTYVSRLSHVHIGFGGERVCFLRQDPKCLSNLEANAADATKRNMHESSGNVLNNPIMVNPQTNPPLT